MKEEPSQQAAQIVRKLDKGLWNDIPDEALVDNKVLHFVVHMINGLDQVLKHCVVC